MAKRISTSKTLDITPKRSGFSKRSIFAALNMSLSVKENKYQKNTSLTSAYCHQSVPNTVPSLTKSRHRYCSACCIQGSSPNELSSETPKLKKTNNNKVSQKCSVSCKKSLPKVLVLQERPGLSRTLTNPPMRPACTDTVGLASVTSAKDHVRLSSNRNGKDQDIGEAKKEGSWVVLRTDKLIPNEEYIYDECIDWPMSAHKSDIDNVQTLNGTRSEDYLVLLEELDTMHGSVQKSYERIDNLFNDTLNHVTQLFSELEGLTDLVKNLERKHDLRPQL